MSAVPYTRNPLMEGFTEDYFETSDHVKLRYLHKGEGMPLILLHGYSDDADTWLLNAPEFAKHYSVYAIDLRGHGFSYAEHGARVARVGADIHEFIESLGVPKVNILGWSFGCSVIWSYMENFGQDKVNKAVFDDEPPMLVANPRFNRDQVMQSGSNRMDFWYLVNTVADYGCAWGAEGSPFFDAFPACFERGAQALSEDDYRNLPDNYWELYNQRPELITHTPFQFMADLLKDHLMNDWRDVLPTIQVPCLYLTGDISHATTLECGAWMRDSLPNCKWVRMSAEDMGIHDMNQTAYKKFNQIVLDFLSE